MKLASWIKRQVLYGYDQFHARKNLFHLRDKRYARLHLDSTLLAAAQTWPEHLPLKPDTIVDVGAHRGEIAKQLATLYAPSFIALVEPLPQMAPVLQTLKLAKDQRLFSCALGRQSGTAQLNILASLPSSSLLSVTPESEKLFHRPMDQVDILQVPVRTLDEIWNECGLDKLDLLKIDVQGYEMEVLAGGRWALRHTRLIVIEMPFFCHYENQPLFGELYRFLRETGFELRATLGFLYDDSHLPLQCDAVFINRLHPK